MDIPQGYSPVPPTIVNLSLIPLEELIQEIARRHHAMVLAACVHKDLNHYQVIHRYFGHKHSCLGLASNLEYRINKEELEGLKPSLEQ